MNRRDTIVVAVLINAGVLVVLFTSALKSKAQEEQIVMSSTPAVQEVAIAKENAVAPRDEVDAVIKQFTAAPPVENSALPIHENIPQETLAATPADFAADLSALGQQEVQAPAQESAPLAQAVENKKGYTEVKVKKGDFLAKIAKRHHTTVDAIMKLNHLTSTNLKIGQTLKIPTSQKTQAPLASKPKEVAQEVEGAKYYIVRNGDNPWTIAVKNKIKVEDLLKLNNLDAEKAKRLKPGDKIRIR